MQKNETRVETVGLEDAEIVLAAYGTAARMCLAAREAFEGKIRIGLIRPKTLWPFPRKAFDRIGPSCKAVLCPEINIIGQMVDDVRIAAAGRWPVHHVGDSRCGALTPERIIDAVARAWKGDSHELHL